LIKDDDEDTVNGEDENMPSKKIRENVFHVRVGAIGTDTFSASYGRMENTNPAKLALSLVDLCTTDLLHCNPDKPEDNQMQRDFYMTVGLCLVKMAAPNDEANAAPLKDTLAKCELLLNQWEMDAPKRDAEFEKLMHSKRPSANLEKK
jgi:hypothetical protein